MEIYKIDVFEGDNLFWSAFIGNGNEHDIMSQVSSVIFQYGIMKEKELRITSTRLTQRPADGCVCVEPLDHPYDEKYCGACGKRRR